MQFIWMSDQFLDAFEVQMVRDNFEKWFKNWICREYKLIKSILFIDI